MGNKLLHTPAGVRDIYGEACIKKERAEIAIKREMREYGFLEIKTPGLEYFDIFNSERGTVSSRDMYKFTDRDGETLVLRPDITPQVARCIAKYYRDNVMPIRLFYHGNTFVNNDGLKGKLKEITQIGAELVNAADPTADAEMIALTIDALKAVGLTKFQIEIGNADFFRGISETAGFSSEETEELRNLISQKNLFGVEQMLSGKDIDEELKKMFTGLPLQFGGIDFIKEYKDKTTSEKAVNALTRLEEIYEKLCLYGMESYISFDLGMLSQYDYYTGVVFKAYTHKTGEPVAAGGRYDKLLSQFGKPAPAIGIAIYVDYVLNAMMRQGISQQVVHDSTLVLYDAEYEAKAIAIAGSLRADHLKIILVKRDEDISEEEYEAFADSILAGGILYVDATDSIRIKDLATREIHEKRM